MPVLETARLRLRPLEADDSEHLLALDADPEVRRYVDQPLPPSRDDVERALLRMLARYGPALEPAFWAAESRASGEFLGWFHLRPVEGEEGVLDLGYRLRRAAWGRGYATEGAQALVRRAFAELDAEIVVAHALEANAASIRVLEKCGLRLRERYLHRGELPAVTYALDRATANAAGPPDGWKHRSPRHRD